MKFLGGLKAVFAITAALAAAQSAMAALVNVAIIGIFTIGDRRGESFSAQLRYDTDAAVTGVSGTTTVFQNAGDLFTLTVGGVVYDLSPPRAIVEDDPAQNIGAGFTPFALPTNRRLGFTDQADSIAALYFYGSILNDARSLPTFSELAQLPVREIEFTENGRVSTGTFSIQPLGAVPEPASWAMMITGFGLIGCAARMRRRSVSFSYA